MWLNIQIFGFRALWSPYFFLFLLSIAVVYFLLTGPFKNKFIGHVKPTFVQQLLFYFGLILLYVVKGSPIDLLSHIMLTSHMLQMALLYFVVTIFLIKGIPTEWWNKFVHLPIIKPVFKFFTHPLIALGLFNSLFALYHIPAIFDFTKSSQVVHSSVTILLFVLAIFMWWPIVTPLKKYDILNPLLKIGYLVISIFIIAIACALIIFASDPLFTAYSSTGAWIQALSLCVPNDVLSGLSGQLSGPEVFSPLSTIHDQQLGGIIMMTLQEFIYGIVLSKIFFGWFNKKNLSIDPLPKDLPQ